MTVYNMKYLVEQESKTPKLKHHKFRVRAAIFLTYLLRMYRYKDVITLSPKEIEDDLGIPKDIVDHLLKTYATLSYSKGDSKTKFHFVRSKKHKDKLICHIIVLLLIIREYHFDVKHLINALKIDFVKLVNYLRMVSCFPKKTKKVVKEGEEEETPDKEIKKRKSEWSLSNTGSLTVYLKAPMRFRNKTKK